MCRTYFVYLFPDSLSPPFPCSFGKLIKLQKKKITCVSFWFKKPSWVNLLIFLLILYLFPQRTPAQRKVLKIRFSMSSIFNLGQSFCNCCTSVYDCIAIPISSFSSCYYLSLSPSPPKKCCLEAVWSSGKNLNILSWFLNNIHEPLYHLQANLMPTLAKMMKHC